jgi:hypothetical protein
MKFLGFDLASLFTAPVVTEEPEIPEPQTPMPVEYNEIDTSSTVTVGNAPPVIPEVDNMHQRMYDLAVKTPTTVTIGGSENLQAN